MIVSPASILCFLLAAPAALAAAGVTATSTPADAADKHIYVGQYDLATNLWGIRGAGGHWDETLFTGADGGMDGSGYTWSGFDGNASAVKAYPSLRYGASNRQNRRGESGLPYRFGSNDRNVGVVWDFSASNVDGKYNHTLDIFFNATDSPRQSEIRGEIMVITDSSQDAYTAGWGVRDAVPFVIGGETWDVWQATQASNGHSWHVTQFRRRINAQHFEHNLRDFFGEAAARRPDIFSSSHYVMMVEAGTEIKTGSGRMVYRRFSVSVY